MKNLFENIVSGILQLVAIAIAAIIFIWVWHLVTPYNWHFLMTEQLTEVSDFFINFILVQALVLVFTLCYFTRNKSFFSENKVADSYSPVVSARFNKTANNCLTICHTENIKDTNVRYEYNQEKVFTHITLFFTRPRNIIIINVWGNGGIYKILELNSFFVSLRFEDIPDGEFYILLSEIDCDRGGNIDGNTGIRAVINFSNLLPIEKAKTKIKIRMFLYCLQTPISPMELVIDYMQNRIDQIDRTRRELREKYPNLLPTTL